MFTAREMAQLRRLELMAAKMKRGVLQGEREVSRSGPGNAATASPLISMWFAPAAISLFTSMAREWFSSTLRNARATFFGSIMVPILITRSPFALSIPAPAARHCLGNS